MQERYLIVKKRGSCNDLCGTCPPLRKLECIFTRENSSRFVLYRIDSDTNTGNDGKGSGNDGDSDNGKEKVHRLLRVRTMDSIGNYLGNKLEGTRHDLSNVEFEAIPSEHRARMDVGLLRSNGR